MPEKSILGDIFFHAAVLIPLEFGILHATPLGPAITSMFQTLFTAAGFAFAPHDHAAELALG
jgi:hypothetical protein